MQDQRTRRFRLPGTMLSTAPHADETTKDAAAQARNRSDWLRQFVIAFGTDENDEVSTFNGTIPQVLALFNGDLIEAATSTAKGSFLSEVAHDTKTNAREKLNLLYRAALARDATAEERKWANQAFVGSENVTVALQNVWWTLLNTNEFILNH